jgi:hypothetical protein
VYSTCPLCNTSGFIREERGFCSNCDFHFQRVLDQMYARFDTYLAHHAAFAEWLALHGKE